ncbi:MAG: LytTR family DNA-binding domain-containing protein, partial [Gammaproteobacteria bacterium]|nr:LytTR family DNA-binding domain-containing protein [Gammaproteobacteria bacterium]
QALDGVEVAGEAANGRAAIEAVQQLEPDVVLMDIRMPGISGIEAAHHLATLERPPAVIFTTAYDEHAIEAFDAQAVGYLLKPVRRERLERTLKRAARPTRAQLSGLAGEDEVAAPRTHICARVRDGLELVPVRDIFYFHADQKYTTVRHGDGEVLIDESLKALEDEFGNDFVRLHRNALAAVRHLQTLERQADGKYYAVFRECDERLAVSRRHAPAVRRRLRAG